MNIYHNCLSDQQQEWSGTFASPLIIQSFAAHLTYTINAVAIKKLKDLEDKQPAAALALATAAVCFIDCYVCMSSARTDLL